MFSFTLVQNIEGHAEGIAAQIAGEVRRDPRLTAMRAWTVNRFFNEVTFYVVKGYEAALTEAMTGKPQTGKTQTVSAARGKS